MLFIHYSFIVAVINSKIGFFPAVKPIGKNIRFFFDKIEIFKYNYVYTLYRL